MLFLLHAAVYFNTACQQLALGTDQLAILPVIVPPGIKTNMVQSHTSTVVGVKYSKCFDQVVTACEGAVSDETISTMYMSI